MKQSLFSALMLCLHQDCILLEHRLGLALHGSSVFMHSYRTSPLIKGRGISVNREPSFVGTFY